MRTRWTQRIAAGVAAIVLSAGCGYFLHPERRGNRGGGVEAGTLVMDLLWLIPGVVPGVVALIVDFSSGAVYNGRERVAVAVPPNGRLTVQLPESSQPAQLDVRLTTATNRVLAEGTAQLGPSSKGKSMVFQIDESRLDPREKVYFEVVSARTPTPASL
jgi:hypothetical protein